MNDTNVSNSQAPAGAPRWLLLVAQLPPKPDYLRVKLRRRVQRIGAVALRSSVFALPNRPDTLEDFAWLRSELLADGAEALVCASIPVAGLTDAELEDRFRRRSAEDYEQIADEARTAVMSGSRDEAARALGRLRKRLDEAGEVDFFGAPNADDARRAVEQLASAAAAPSAGAITAGSALPRSGRTWVTREGVFVDRIASAWLIRRFIDRDARFRFVPAQGYAPAPGELRFDMFDAEYTHEGDRCTFETLLARFGLDEPALATIGEIVHDIDCKDAKYDRAEAPGVESMLAGLARSEPDDLKRIERGSAIFEAIYVNLSE